MWFIALTNYAYNTIFCLSYALCIYRPMFQFSIRLTVDNNLETSFVRTCSYSIHLTWRGESRSQHFHFSDFTFFYKKHFLRLLRNAFRIFCSAHVRDRTKFSIIFTDKTNHSTHPLFKLNVCALKIHRIKESFENINILCPSSTNTKSTNMLL